MKACEKCGVDLEEYECSRTDERLTVPHRPSQCLANLTAQCDRLAARLAEVDRFIRWAACFSDESNDELREGLTNWDVADVYRFAHDTIIGAREALAAISATGGKEPVK